jgi:MoaA/NifB/PqqE/SkfB family radical SAM enzyme
MSFKRSIVPKIINGRKAEFVRKRLVLFLLWNTFKTNWNPWKTFREVQKLRKFRAKLHGNQKILKFIKAENQYFWATENYGFPSNNLKNFIQLEFQRNKKTSNSQLQPIPQQTIVWGITNRCMLQCKHCYDWDNIDKKDHLGLTQLIQILRKIELQGITHIQLSGGEPLARFNDLISIVQEASRRIDFWILTSGFGLTEEKAVALKKAGLKGVNISLDHWDEVSHNDFRNNSKSFEWVIKAIGNCRKAGIMVSLSLCATREFTTTENLSLYLNLAKEEGVHFVRILEPRKVGNFSNQNVALNKSQVEMISEFTIQMNTNPEYKDFPIVVFFGYHQRKLGCMGAGNRYLYIDSNGEFHACPFCQGSIGNALSKSFNDAIIQLRKNKCQAFKMY